MVGLGALVLAVVAPFIVSSYWIGSLLTQMLFLGIVAASLIFLSAYGGMVSLAQVAIYGIAGFVFGNLTTNGNTKGLNLGWSPWVGIVVGIAIAVGIAMIFGALASRSAGIYFLMITLTYSVIANLFFGQVTDFSGFGGISGIQAPSWIGNVDAHRNRLYYAALVLSVLVYVLIRYIVRTPFGLTLQGVRDEPVRMASLGYNVALHRTLAFGFAAFVASLSGILYVWWSGQIAPGNVDLPETINLLVMAVIGGLVRIEGAWLGAFVFIVIQNYVRDFAVPGLSFGGTLFGGSFNTIVGIIFLVIVLVSPGGLIGIWDRGFAELARRRNPPRADEPAASPGT
jgi:branched-chain amino acid transport system permease protein